MKLTSLLILAWCCAATTHADVLTLGADKDATIFQNNVNNSNGAGPGIFAGTNGTLSPRRGLISFDLSSIPAGSIITDVQFTLTLGQVAGSGGAGSGGNDITRSISLYELTRGWGEGITGNTSTTIGGTGQGFTANPGDATWNAAAHGSTAWTTPGGDYQSTASASLTLTGTTVGTAYTWLSTPSLVDDVQGWLNNPATNFGWIMINADETGSQTFFSFYTSEWSDRAGSDPILAAQYAAQEPQLQITFTVPEPSGGLLAGFAALGLLAAHPWRRRVSNAG